MKYCIPREVRTCPICGAKTIDEYGPMIQKVGPREKGRYYYFVECQKCHQSTALFKHEEDAIAEWNWLAAKGAEKHGQ